MVVRLLLAALAAGLLAGILVTPVQYARVVPLILQAERFEAGGAHHHAATQKLGSVGLAHAHGPGAAAGEAADEPPPGGRLIGTLLANVVTGGGFALLLAAASLLCGIAVTRRTGLVWGLAGFATASLAPALGLPPELPAMPAADLAARQLWWWATVALTAAGLAGLALRPEPWAKAGGILLLALPHLIGAPRPADLASPVPPTLAAEFAVASLATAAAFWLMLGALAGLLLDRARAAAPAAGQAR